MRRPLHGFCRADARICCRWPRIARLVSSAAVFALGAPASDLIASHPAQSKRNGEPGARNRRPWFRTDANATAWQHSTGRSRDDLENCALEISGISLEIQVQGSVGAPISATTSTSGESSMNTVKLAAALSLALAAAPLAASAQTPPTPPIAITSC